MEAVRIFRQLWEHRLLVACGLLVATVIGTSIAYHVAFGIPPTFKSREYQVGVASVDIFVDSGLSQVSDLGGGKLRTDLATLSPRAQLLANLLAARLLRESVAVRAGIDPRLFHARVLGTSTDAAPKEPSALDVPDGPRANLLTVSVRDVVPIITIDAQAADAATAGRIASAAIAELGSYQKEETIDTVPDARRLVLKTLGQPRSATEVRGPRRINGLVAFVLILGLWCGVLVLRDGFARRWRESTLEADMDDDQPAALRGRSRREVAPERPSGSRRTVAPERPGRDQPATLRHGSPWAAAPERPAASVGERAWRQAP